MSIWMPEGYVRVPCSIQLDMYVLPTLPCIPYMRVGMRVGRVCVREGVAVPELGHIGEAAVRPFGACGSPTCVCILFPDGYVGQPFSIQLDTQVLLTLQV